MLVMEKSVSKRLEIVLRSRKEKINKLQLHNSVNSINPIGLFRYCCHIF